MMSWFYSQIREVQGFKATEEKCSKVDLVQDLRVVKPKRKIRFQVKTK
jgi:hypothetical protein